MVSPRGPCRYTQSLKHEQFNMSLSDRTKALSKPHELDTWTKFTFPGRKSKYSDLKYHWKHFSGVDYDSRKKEHGIFKFVGDGKRNDWAHDVSKELGNYDYL